MISLTAEYALRAVVWMAGQPGKPVGTRDIAEATQVPVGYLSKVLQALARSALVRSRPGRAGGFVLGREPATISVLDVIQAVDPLHRIERCPLGRPQHNKNLCPLHRRLNQAVSLVERAFADSTIAELAAEGMDDGALCPRGEPSKIKPPPRTLRTRPRRSP